MIKRIIISIVVGAICFIVLTFFIDFKDYHKVDYKKPYLAIDFDKFDNLIIKMYDYDSKDSVDVNTHRFKEITPGHYDKYNGDYLLTSAHECKILVIHRNSESEIFDPCSKDTATGASVINIAMNEKYLIAEYNIGYSEKGYDYGIGIFNHQYELLEYLRVDGFMTASNIFGEQIYYNYNNDSDNYNSKSTTAIYNIITKEKKEKLENSSRIGFYLKLNDNIYYGDNNCDIYLGDKLVYKSEKNTSACYNSNSYHQNDKEGNIIKDISYPEGERYLRFDKNNPYKVELIKDNVCNHFTYYTSQGKYCKDKKEENIYFNDHVNPAKKLDIDIKQGHTFAFYDWE